MATYADLERPEVYRKLRKGFRAYAHRNFGGLDWLHLLLAVGDIDVELTLCANDEISRITATVAARTASYAPPPPRPLPPRGAVPPRA